MYPQKIEFREQAVQLLDELQKNWTKLKKQNQWFAFKQGVKMVAEDSPRMKIKKDKLRRVMKKAWQFLESGEAKTKGEALKKAWKWAKSAKEQKKAVKTKDQTLLF